MSKFEASVERYLLGECEKALQVWPSIGDCATCPTGEPYITFASVPKQEGEAWACDESISIARDRFLQAFKDYSTGKKGMLFWRQKPVVVYVEPVFYESEFYTYNQTGGFCIYARLVISEVKESE